MSINGCSINGFTLDARRCRDKFADLLPIFRPPVLPSIGGNPRVLRDTFTMPRQFEIEDQPVLTFEQPIVSVTVEFYGTSGTDTQDVSAASVDFVTVTGLEVQGVPKVSGSDEPTISVNIFDLHFD